MATKEEWLDFFKLINGRTPTPEEFMEAKKSGEFDAEESEEEKSGLKSEEQKEEAENSEEQESEVISDSSKGSESSQETVELEKEETLNPLEQKKNENSNKFRELIAPLSAFLKKNKKWTVITASALAVLLLSLGIYLGTNSSKKEVVADSTLLYNGKLITLSDMKPVNLKFERLLSRNQVGDYYFVRGYLKDSETVSSALVNLRGEIVDDELIVYNCSTADKELRLAEKVPDGDSLKSTQELYYSKVTKKYYATQTDQSAGMIELSEASMKDILEREDNASLIILNDSYYESTVNTVKSIKEMQSGKVIYNSKDHPNIFGGYTMSNKYMLSDLVKKGNYYTYNVYQMHDFEEELFTVEIPVSSAEVNLQGEWLADGETYVAGEKDSSGNYTTVCAVDAKAGKVAEVELEKGTTAQVSGNNLAKLSVDNEVTVLDNKGKAIISEILNPGEIANASGKGTDAQVKDVNEAYEAVAKAEKAKTEAEAKLEEAKKEAEEKAKAQKMDLKAVQSGDLSSVIGIWENGEGKVITIEEDAIVATDVLNGITIYADSTRTNNGESPGAGGFGTSEYGGFKAGTTKISGKTYNTGSAIINGVLQISTNGSTSTPSLFMIPAGEDFSKVQPTGGEDSNNKSTLGESWYSSGDVSDKSKDRIVFAQTAIATIGQVPTSISDNNYVYYKVVDRSNLVGISSEDQTKIDEAIKSAQTAVDKLKDYDWAETNMMDLQKRLDALSGNDIIEKMKSSTWKGEGGVVPAPYSITWGASGKVEIAKRENVSSDRYTDFSYEVTGPNEVTMSYYEMDTSLAFYGPIFVDGIGGTAVGSVPRGNVECQAVFQLSDDAKTLTLVEQRVRTYMTDKNGADVSTRELNEWSDWSSDYNRFTPSFDFYSTGASAYGKTNGTGTVGTTKTDLSGLDGDYYYNPGANSQKLFTISGNKLTMDGVTYTIDKNKMTFTDSEGNVYNFYFIDGFFCYVGKNSGFSYAVNSNDFSTTKTETVKSGDIDGSYYFGSGTDDIQFQEKFTISGKDITIGEKKGTIDYSNNSFKIGGKVYNFYIYRGFFYYFEKDGKDIGYGLLEDDYPAVKELEAEEKDEDKDGDTYMVTFHGDADASSIWLNVRESPSTSSASLGKLYEGNTVQVIETVTSSASKDVDGGNITEWAKVTYKDKTAYLALKYLEKK